MKDLISEYLNITDILDLPIMEFASTLMYLFVFENGTESREFDGNVTFLIPCYNKSSYIEETVNSCLASTVKANINVLLMDEKSIQKKEILESRGVKCYVTERMNVCKARTFLVDNCDTDWFIFLDADDLIDKDYIKVLSQDKGAIRFGSCKLEDQDVPFGSHDIFKKCNLTNLLTYNNTCLMHKDVFYNIGYDEQLCKGGEDTDFSLRLLAKKKWLISHNPKTYYVYKKSSENQLTKDISTFNESILKYYTKNKDILSESIKDDGTESYKEAKRILENFSEEEVYNYYYKKKFKSRNIKKELDKLASYLYDKAIEYSKGIESKPVNLKYGRVFTVEDIIKKADALPDYVGYKELHPIDRFFTILQKYNCVETEVFCSKENHVSNKDFLEWSKICIDSKSTIGVFIKMFTKLQGGN